MKVARGSTQRSIFGSATTMSVSRTLFYENSDEKSGILINFAGHWCTLLSTLSSWNRLNTRCINPRNTTKCMHNLYSCYRPNSTSEKTSFPRLNKAILKSSTSLAYNRVWSEIS